MTSLGTDANRESAPTAELRTRQSESFNAATTAGMTSRGAAAILGSVSTAASRTSDALRLLVVNRTREDKETATTNTITAALKLPESSQSESVVTYVLHSENLGDRSAVPGTYDRVHEILVRRSQVEVPEKGVITISFPPHSATLVELVRASD